MAVELKQADESPERAAAQALFRAAFSVHPYGRSVLGTDAAVAAVTREQLAAAYQRIYGGRNLTLVAVGDFDAPALKTKIAAAFASLRKGEPPAARRIEPAQSAPRTVVLARDLPETQLWLAFHTPPVDPRRRRGAGSAVGDSGTAGPALGRRRAARAAAGAQPPARQRAPARTPSPRATAACSSSVRPRRRDASRSRRARSTTRWLRLAREEVTPDELDAARTQALAGVVRDQETPAGYARKLGFFASIGGDVARDEAYRARIAALTPADLRAVAARYLRAPGVASAALVSSRGVTGGRGAADPTKIAARLDAVWNAGEARADRRFAAVPIARPGDEVVRVVLPSGLRVLVLRDPSAGLVDMQAMWPGGLRYEDARSNGISNLLAAMLTRGTKGRPGFQLAAELDAMPGTIAGFSTRNALGLRAELPGTAWERGLELLADCILNPLFADDELERQRRAVLDQIRAQARDATATAFQPVRVGAVDAPSLSLARARHRRHGGGAVAPSPGRSLSPLLRRRRSDDRGRRQRRAGAGRRQDPVAARRRRRRRPRRAPIPRRAGAQRAGRGLPRDAVRRRAGGDRLSRDHAARSGSVLARGAGRDPVGPERPSRGGVSRSAPVRARVGGRGHSPGIEPGSLAIAFQCRSQNLEPSVAAARAELARVVERGVTADEVGRARRYLIGAHAVALEPRSAIAAALAVGRGLRPGPARVPPLRRRRSNRITPADVQRVARKFIDPRHEVVAVVRPPDDDPARREAPRATTRASPRPPRPAR